MVGLVIQKLHKNIDFGMINFDGGRILDDQESYTSKFRPFIKLHISFEIICQSCCQNKYSHAALLTPT